MKIPREFPKFQGKNALIVVTGLHEADFYIAKDGFLEKIGDFKLLFPRYSDKEGFFEHAGHGRIFETGSVLEKDKIEIRHRFLKEMDEILDQVVMKRDITDIYIFTPDFLKKELKELLPKEDRKKIRYIIKGNYTHLHPLQVLEIIGKKEKIGWKVPLSEEARKILKLPISIREKKKR